MSHARRTALKIGATLTTVALLAACSGGGDGSAADKPAASTVTQAQIDEALSTPTTLTFWTWVPDIDAQVALFEAKYPAIDVKVENVGQGGAMYTKLRTALEAKETTADVVQVEYQQIPSFVITESLLDLTPYGAGDLAGDYTEWVWNQVVQGDAVYAIPQDAGPMGNLYRADILEQAGITEAPATYEEYAEAARAVKSATGSYISNLAPSDPAQLIGLLWQAGVKPFGYDGKQTVTIDVNSSEAKDVMSYWEGLIKEDVVSVDADFTDQWYQGLANGTYAGWLTAAWGPLFLQGTAADTSGLWRAAPLPQWEEGQNVSGNWGGSSNAVLASSKNPIAAYELAKFINSDPESTMMLANEQFLFPTVNYVLESPEFVDQELEFYGGQKVNALFADVTTTVDTEFDWLPFMDYALAQFTETVGVAMTEKGDLSAGLDAWQAVLETYATQQGFTVK